MSWIGTNSIQKYRIPRTFEPAGILKGRALKQCEYNQRSFEVKREGVIGGEYNQRSFEVNPALYGVLSPPKGDFL